MSVFQSYIVLNDTLTVNNESEKDAEGLDHGLIWGTVLESATKAEENHEVGQNSKSQGLTFESGTYW
jgi:hypothetical protein